MKVQIVVKIPTQSDEFKIKKKFSTKVIILLQVVLTDDEETSAQVLQRQMTAQAFAQPRHN